MLITSYAHFFSRHAVLHVCFFFFKCAYESLSSHILLSWGRSFSESCAKNPRIHWRGCLILCFLCTVSFQKVLHREYKIELLYRSIYITIHMSTISINMQTEKHLKVQNYVLSLLKSTFHHHFDLSITFLCVLRWVFACALLLSSSAVWAKCICCWQNLSERQRDSVLETDSCDRKDWRETKKWEESLLAHFILVQPGPSVVAV